MISTKLLNQLKDAVKGVDSLKPIKEAVEIRKLDVEAVKGNMVLSSKHSNKGLFISFLTFFLFSEYSVGNNQPLYIEN